MTGIKFHDYTIPRRSTIHPSQLQGNRRGDQDNSLVRPKLTMSARDIRFQCTDFNG